MALVGAEGDAMSTTTMRVAYTVEQSWHPVPGGTAVAALRVAREFLSNPEFDGHVDLRFVAGKHPSPPDALYVPPGPVAMLPLGRRSLYEGWTRLNWPKVESVTGAVDVVHATGLIPAATSAPLVVTVHDLAFLHTPEKFTRRGASLMTRSIAATRRRAHRVICSSQATFDDCVAHEFDPDRLRLVPLGADSRQATSDEIAEARTHHELPAEFVLFVGTIEPRKNLRRLIEAMRHVRAEGLQLPLVVVGADGWGDVRSDIDAAHVRFLGPVSDADLRGLFAGASVMAYPSEREGFGLPVIEAMAQGTAVVTSRGTSTEEAAGGAAVLVDPFEVADIARGVAEAYGRRGELAELGHKRAGELTWERSARATLAVYRELVS
jgi:glycosyltransferase involved in cell wall biosynthesis